VLGDKAKGIVVFPGTVKGGFIIGGQYVEGALIKNSKTVGDYNSVSLSYGLQAGAQKFGYALFFMTDSAMAWLDKSNGWELGTGRSIIVVDVGITGLPDHYKPKTGQPYQYRKRLLRGLGEKAGVKYFSYNCLRHFGASKLDSRGVPLTHIQKTPGHERVTTTGIYQQSLRGGTDEAVKKLEDLGE